MKVLSTRSREVAETIAACEDFKTYGALSGRRVDGLGYWDDGQLSGPDRVKFREDCYAMTYVVWSYLTPIAWRLQNGDWYRVKAKFSVTTSKHQGKLFLIDAEQTAGG